MPVNAHGIIYHCERQQEQVYQAREEGGDLCVCISFPVAGQCMPFPRTVSYSDWVRLATKQHPAEGL